MLRKSLALGTSLAATLVVAGCADQTTAPVATPKTRAAVATSSGLRGSATGLVASAVRDLNLTGGSRIIAGNPNACNVASPINDYLDASLAQTFSTADETNRFFTLYDNLADEVPTYEALVFQSASTPQFYGYTGSFTKAIQKVERDVKRFWDIPSADIEVVAMHGTVLMDPKRVAATYVSVYGLPADAAMFYAKQDSAALDGSVTMNKGNYPFWTFNAVSFPGEHDQFFDIPAKIVMGDGLLEGYEAVGFGDVAPQAIFAHEFAHQIQFANNYDLGNPGDAPLPPRVTAAEFTRYNELMADTYAGYYLTHARGGTLRQKRVEQFLSTFFQIGDCGFTSGGHHGTPSQRLAAARFGFQLANEAQKQGHILSSAEIHELFVAQYPSIVALDVVAAK